MSESKANIPEKKQIPALSKLLTDVALYTSYEINADDWLKIWNLAHYTYGFDVFCPGCNRESHFKHADVAENYKLSLQLNEFSKREAAKRFVQQGVLTIRFNCARSNASTHKFIAIFIITAEFDILSSTTTYFLTKIGQPPSLGDINLPSISKYRDVLGVQYKELSRAIKLSSYDVGVGSFVYLRRIFEGLIDAAHQEAKVDLKKWNEKKYVESRMEDKIKILEKYLPLTLVKNRKLYAILSKGIHELTEDECLTYFNVVRQGIELILDEKLHEIQSQKKNKEIESAIHNMHTKIKQEVN